MTEAIERIRDFVIAKEQTAASVAQRFGMHAHDDGFAVTFTPRDRRFSRGAANKRWKSEVLNDVTLDVAPHEALTVGEMRAAFGAFARLDGEHDNDAPRWTANYSPPDGKRQCDIVFDLAVPSPKGDLSDDLRIKRVELISGVSFEK